MSYDGYVDKYEGDAIMCDFGVPIEDPDHAWKACWAALDQQEKLKTLREEIKRAILKAIEEAEEDMEEAKSSYLEEGED